MITKQYFLNNLYPLLYVPDLEGESRLYMQYKKLSSASTHCGLKAGRKISVKPRVENEESGFVFKADKWWVIIITDKW